MVLTMKSILSGFLTIAVLFVLSVPQAAQADYVVWKDSDTGLSLSWPDSWRIVSSADPDDVITIMAPSGRGHAACRVRAREDMRFAIYPPHYAGTVQRVGYSADFWSRYLAEYTDYQIYRAYDGAGLGRGFASYAIAGYESAVPGPYMARRSIMFASNYNNIVYILECSSHEDTFTRWQNLFLSIAGSVDFKPARHQLRNGHYRNFISDRRIQFRGDEGPNRVVY